MVNGQLLVFTSNNRILKIILLNVGDLSGVLALLYVMMRGIIYLTLTGVWTFPPLERIFEEFALENGGRIVVIYYFRPDLSSTLIPGLTDEGAHLVDKGIERRI